MGKNCPRNRFWNVLRQQPFLSVNYMELMERVATEQADLKSKLFKLNEGDLPYVLVPLLLSNLCKSMYILPHYTFHPLPP